MKRTFKKVKLVSTQNTGAFYVTKKSVKLLKKLAFRKYDSVLRCHCEFKEAKI
ncbi:MAG: 50S ribosomal protein L33 [Candidatus Hodgkinia cicadicola]